MDKTKRLAPVIRMAHHFELEAAQLLARYRQEHEHNEKKLAELVGFYEDYIARLSATGHTGASMRTINEYRRFLARLHEAVKQQRQLVRESAEQLEEVSRNWQERNTERRALDKAIDRFEQHECRRERRHDQSASDERAQHMTIDREKPR